MTRDGRPSNIGASVRGRLLTKARAEKLDFNLLLTRYALERLLYRMSISEQRDQFLLKGALLFDLWFDIPHRPTHDADFLGFGSAEIPHLENVFRDISRIEIEDGIVFQPDSVKAAEIRKDANYAGVRVTLIGCAGQCALPHPGRYRIWRRSRARPGRCTLPNYLVWHACAANPGLSSLHGRGRKT